MIVEAKVLDPIWPVTTLPPPFSCSVIFSYNNIVETLRDHLYPQGHTDSHS
jgi:hypothetical protein